jgi:hypothetical protein
MTFIEERDSRTVLVLWMGNTFEKMPTGSGSLFYNYKHSFSILLLALVDANYCFIAADVGTVGKSSDSSVFKKSNIEGNWNRINWESQGAGCCRMTRMGNACLSCLWVTSFSPCQNTCYDPTRIGILAFNNEYTCTD